MTTIGGHRDDKDCATNDLLCLPDNSLGLLTPLPPMPTARVRPAAVSTPTHLIVAGGKTKLFGAPLSAVEMLEFNTLQWFACSCSPIPLACPNSTLCGGHIYLSQNKAIFSCGIQELVASASISRSEGRSLWTQLNNIPVPYSASLTTLRDHVVAIGGTDNESTGAIHCYDRTTNSWKIIGEIPTKRFDTLVAVLPTNTLIVVGGWHGENMCKITEIVRLY